MKTNKQLLFERMKYLNPDFKGDVNEISYDDAKNNEDEYSKRIELALDDFNHQNVKLTVINEEHNLPTKINVIINTYSEKTNPYNIAISLSVHLGYDQLIGIGLHENIKPDQVFWKSKFTQIPQETIIFFEKFIRKAAPFVGIQDESTIDSFISVADQKMGMKNKI